MSLKINTNLQALTAMRYLGLTEDRMQGSVTRLSTGLRINSAGDDPSGMIISEGMRSQIKGLEQAIRNSQDAVNMSKTAEGALDEVQRLLLSLRAISVSSANTAVVDANQLAANQTQVRSVIQSINRIADQTTWGNKKLLNGASGAVANVTNTNLVTSMYLGSEFGGQGLVNGNLSITRVTAATQTTTTLATSFANTAAAVGQGTFSINGVTFATAPGETVGTLLAKINQQSDKTGVTAGFAAGSGITLTSIRYGNKFPIQYTETSTILNNGAGSTPTVGNNAVYTVTASTSPGPTASETFTGGQGPDVDGLTLTSSSGNRLVITPSGNATAATTVVGSATVGSMRFQIGANANQAASFSLPSVEADNLGTVAVPGQSVGSIDVSNQTGATNAIRIIDDAIQQLATLRGQLGSFQRDFLESNIRSLGVASENMTASESTIRDADVAKEMTEYTKLQILRQSGMAVLAQANQAPQSVLSLLRGGG